MNDFDVFWRILCEAFPEEEHRNREGQEALLNNPAYHLHYIREEGQILGFWSTWDFESFLFVEHLALDSVCRGKGYGTSALQQIFDTAGKSVILEVEKPETEKAKRRIALYERLGLHLNTYDYFQPPLQTGQGCVPMYIMSWPSLLNEMDFKRVRSELYRIVYHWVD